MKRIPLILAAALIAFAISSNAQSFDWRKMQSNGDSFHTIQQQANQHFQDKSTAKESANYSREFKHYKRWEHY